MTPVVVSARGGGADEIEDFIMDILGENPTGLSVQDIVNDLAEAQLEIRRQTLVVRLHRMVRAGKLSSLAHGHYVLSEAERSRRRA
jgi:DNA-binding transcriptional regulator PaaX